MIGSTCYSREDYDEASGWWRETKARALPLARQLPEHTAQVASELAVQHLPAVLRNSRDVVLALPCSVG